MVKYTIGDALKEGIALLNQNSIKNAGIDARVLLQNAIGCDALHLTVHANDELLPDAQRIYNEFLQKRTQNVPVAYITKSKEFMSLDFYVDENVLVPRPDTEVLCEEVIDLLNGKNARIVDMCTGSGCIAVSLAKYLPDVEVVGLDISPNAVEIATRNAEQNGVGTRCRFEVFDVKNPYHTKVDAVVSNPPYIPKSVIATLQSDVKDHEPTIALDGGNSGFDFYDAIINNLKSCLKVGGTLAFECGHDQAKQLASMMKPYFEEVYTVRDLGGIERCVIGTKFYAEVL